MRKTLALGESLHGLNEANIQLKRFGHRFRRHAVIQIVQNSLHRHAEARRGIRARHEDSVRH
ncbi:MAG: hypothetical protein NTZ56_00070 [Acidobacteria bacterium]|nr:hypothetical protein [Acidobacteriota bacterium]